MITPAQVLDELASACHRTARAKGFWDGTTPLERGPEAIALMHSELSEALEAMRAGYGSANWVWTVPSSGRQAVTEEFADVIIRVLDFCGAAALPIGEAVVEKMAKNAERPHMHGKAF